MQISKFKANELIQKTNGKIFSVSFIKKDGSHRHMVARLGVHKNLKGGKNGAGEHNSLVTVWDMVANGYRMLNLETLLSISMNKTTYQIV